MDKYIPCRWMMSFVYLRNLATSDIPISGFPGYLLDVCKYTCTFSVTNLCLQVVVRSELFDKNSIMLVAVRILIQGKYDL